MSVVYRAREASLGGRPVALKLLSPTLGADPDYRERFVREAGHAAAVEHPHLVPVYRAGVSEGRPFLAMRLVDGPDLRRLLDRGPLEPPRATSLLGQVARALDAVHRAGLIHRDVKPGNVLVTTSDDGAEHGYLTDFGIARPATGHHTLTGPGQIVGTAAYLAPEQVAGDPVSPGTDVYALGCLLFECLTGQPPFHRDDARAVLHAHLVAPPPPVSALRPDLPTGLDQALAIALTKDPNARYPSCLALVQAAEDALARPPGVPTPRPLTAAPPVPPAAPAHVPAHAPAHAPAGAPGLQSSVHYQPPRQPTRRLVGALCIWVALAVVDLVVDTGRWADFVPGRPTAWERAVDTGQALAFGLCAVLFVRWLRSAYANIAHLGARGQRFGLGWASAGWFVPILALYRPKQLVNDVWRASDPGLPPAAGEQWRFVAVRPLFAVWWASYLAMIMLLAGHDGLLGWLGSAMTLGLGSALVDAMPRPYPGALAGLTGLLAAALAVAVVRCVYHRQEARAARVGAPATTAG